MSGKLLLTIREVCLSHNTGTETWPSYSGSVARYASFKNRKPFTGSGPYPGPSRKAHPRPSRIGSTADNETTSSIPTSARTIALRCAQGHAQEM